MAAIISRSGNYIVKDNRIVVHVNNPLHITLSYSQFVLANLKLNDL